MRKRNRDSDRTQVWVTISAGEPRTRSPADHAGQAERVTRNTRAPAKATLRPNKVAASHRAATSVSMPVAVSAARASEYPGG